MTPTTERLRQEARNQRRRGIVFVVAVGVSYGHFVAHDGWWSTPEGAVAHTLVSVGLVAAGMWASRVWGALLLAFQPIFFVGTVGVVHAVADWDDPRLEVAIPWHGEACHVEPDTRLYVCPFQAGRARMFMVGPHYGYLAAFTKSTAIRLGVWISGPPPGSYLGPIPDEAEAFVLAEKASPVAMTEAGVDAAFGGSRPWDWKWHGVRSLGAVHLDGGGVLFVWDGGALLDLYDVKTGRLVVSWDRSEATLRLPRFDGTLRDNALWLRRRWLHAPSSDADIAALTERSRAHDITTLYPFVGPMKPGGRFGWRDGDTLVEYDPEVARSFFTRVHAVPAPVRDSSPGLAADRAADLIVVERLPPPPPTILPWTGGVLGRDAFPESPEWRADFVAQAKALVELGADGIHVNIEPMPEETLGYLDLLRELKAALGPDHLVSVAAYPPPTPLHPYADVHWSLAFLREVCAVADDVSVMAYDTALETPDAYAQLMEQWTRELGPAMHDCRWRVGIPSYEEDKPWHRPDAETLSAALDGVIEGLDGMETDDKPAGLAVYASWTTDAQEWAEFDIRRGASPTNIEPIDTP